MTITLESSWMTHFQYSITSSFAFGCSDARWNPNPFCSSSCKKTWTTPLPYNISPTPSNKHGIWATKKNSQFPPYRYTSCFTGIQRMFFLIIPTWPGMITPQILYPQQAPDLVTPAPLVVDLDLVTPQWWSSCLRFKQKQEVKHRKTGQKR